MVASFKILLILQWSTTLTFIINQRFTGQFGCHHSVGVARQQENLLIELQQSWVKETILSHCSIPSVTHRSYWTVTYCKYSVCGYSGFHFPWVGTFSAYSFTGSFSFRWIIWHRSVCWQLLTLTIDGMVLVIVCSLLYIVVSFEIRSPPIMLY